MFQPVITWSGSKRSQSEIIKSFFPETFDNYYEPFVGGGSVMYSVSPQKGVCGDICEPLIKLWNEIKNNPDRLCQSYSKKWYKLQQEGNQIFYEVRNNFNLNNNPEDLMFLSRTCVNGLIRFNKNGEFNNSFHLSRPGIHPDKLAKIINDWSNHIQEIDFVCGDYEDTTKYVTYKDVVYLDPPYFHTKGRYYGIVDFDRFLRYLYELNKKEVKWLLSFDGTRGGKDYTVKIPEELYKRHEYIYSGSSTFKKVIDRENEKVYESLYLNY